MMKLKILVFSCILMMQFSCQKIDEFTRYTLAFITPLEINPTLKLVPSVSNDSINAFESELFLPPYDARLDAHGDDRDNVEKVRMSEFRVFFPQPDTSNFDFVKSIEIFIKNGSAGVLKIGEISGIKKGVTNMKFGILFPWEQDMTDYVENGYRIVVLFTADEQINRNIEIHCHAKFEIDTKKFFI